jgi:hypothetical protein
MLVEKKVPNVYRHHAVLDAAAAPFTNTAGRLIVSEYAESMDWWFSLKRQNGSMLRAVLPIEGRMRSDIDLVKVIRDGLTAMLAA